MQLIKSQQYIYKATTCNLEINKNVFRTTPVPNYKKKKKNNYDYTNKYSSSSQVYVTSFKFLALHQPNYIHEPQAVMFLILIHPKVILFILLLGFILFCSNSVIFKVNEIYHLSFFCYRLISENDLQGLCISS